MYLEHFGLRELPFSLTPDTEFFFNHRGHREALNVLLVALRTGEGFVKITGEVGTGKTLLCRKLLDALQEEFLTAYLPNPLLGPLEIYRAVAEELRLEVPADAPFQEILTLITHHLIVAGGEGKRAVVIIDEVQAMPQESLEALRLLSNLETAKRKLLQIVLFAQPELDERLAQASLRQLRQRIAFSHRLRPLDREALDGYVAHRLLVAGCHAGPLFRPAALATIYRGSQGVPRLINVLCHKALLAAFGQGAGAVDRRHALAAIGDTEGVTRGRRWRWLYATIGLALVLQLSALAYFYGGALP